MGFHEQDYHLIKTSLSKRNNQKEVLRYLTNVLPNPTDIVTLDNAQYTVKSVKVQLANKNLIPYPYSDTTKTVNGITFTDNGDGSLTISGTATGDAFFYLQRNADYGTKLMNAIDKNYATNGIYTASKRLYYNAVNKMVTINILSGTTVDETIYPQIELGTTPTAYTPHVSDLTSVTVTRYGTVETDSPQTYTPAADGTVKGITVLTPTTNIINDKGLLFTKVTGDDFNYIN